VKSTAESTGLRRKTLDAGDASEGIEGCGKNDPQQSVAATFTERSQQACWSAPVCPVSTRETAKHGTNDITDRIRVSVIIAAMLRRNMLSV
jgi:hypothetical protein